LKIRLCDSLDEVSSKFGQVRYRNK
jgi:hypothetical protein